MLRVYGHYKHFNCFSPGTVFTRQILTYKDGPQAERVDALITSTVLFYSFYELFKSVIGKKMNILTSRFGNVCWSQIKQIFFFHPLKVVDRGSETQVGGKLNNLI